MHNYSEFPVAVYDKYSHLFVQDDPLTYIIIEDPVLEHRDLYKNILNFFLSKKL